MYLNHVLSQKESQLFFFLVLCTFFSCSSDSTKFNDKQENYIKETMTEYNSLLKSDLSAMLLDYNVESERKRLALEKKQLDIEEAFEKMKNDIAYLELKVERKSLENEEQQLDVFAEQKRLLNKLRQLELQLQQKIIADDQKVEQAIAKQKEQKESSIEESWVESSNQETEEPVLADKAIKIINPIPDFDVVPELQGNSARAGIASKKRKQVAASCKKYDSESITITLEPRQWMELKSAYVFTNNCGSLDIELKSKKGIQKMRTALVKGKSPIDFYDLDSLLEPEIRYQLTLTPVEGNEYCKNSKLPALENIASCSKPLNTEAAIDIAYNGNVVLYDLKYVY